MEALSAQVWAERDLWELLLFRVHVEEHLGLGGGAGWRRQAALDVEETLASLRAQEVQRAAVASDVAVDLGLAPDAGLREIGLRAGGPWATIMDDHVAALDDSRRRLRSLTARHRATEPSDSDLWQALRGLAALALEMDALPPARALDDLTSDVAGPVAPPVVVGAGGEPVVVPAPAVGLHDQGADVVELDRFRQGTGA